ncbi:hypothetical protein D3C71_1810750 [compost metagenome]
MGRHGEVYSENSLGFCRGKMSILSLHDPLAGFDADSGTCRLLQLLIDMVFNANH